MSTGAFMYALRNSKVVHMNPWILLGCSFATLMGTQMISYEENWALKNMMYAGFVGSISVSLLPLIHVYAMPVIYDALIATGVTVGGLGAVAWNAPSEQFLNWGGPLSLMLGGMCGVSLLSILYPGSKALGNIWLYGGLALFSAFILYDTQQIIYKAKTQRVYDPINGSVGVYLDAINLFVRFVTLFGGSSKK
jgi:FtsH-binding integral membrane protein